MAVKIKFDKFKHALSPTLVLATRSGQKLGVLPATNISVSDSFNSNFELEFKIYKYENGTISPLWDKVTDFKLVWCKEWDVWFEIYVETQESDSTVKVITGTSIGEAELSQICIYNTEINTTDDIARDDYVVTIFYDENNTEGSLLHRIMEKAPHYTISHVDTRLANIQRTFTFDGISIYDAFQEISEEIECIFVIDSGTDDTGNIARSISVYDLNSYCVDCGTRGNFTSVCTECGGTNILPAYGTDTAIFVSAENLAENITYKTDTDSVKNCFRLTAGDDLMTATVKSCNPNGSQYIWYISDELKADMSSDLVSALDAYDTLYEYYQNEHEFAPEESVLEAYNALVSKYFSYDDSLRTISSPVTGFPALMTAYYDTIDFYLLLHDSLMPSVDISSTSASSEASKLTSVSLSPVAMQNLSSCSLATASSAVLSMAKVLVDSRYQVKVNESSFADGIWVGNFTITNYSDDDDTAVSDSCNVVINEDYETFVKQKLTKSLHSSDEDSDEALDIESLFSLSLDNFAESIKQYSLSCLSSFYDACQSCIDILIEQGISDNDTWANQSPDLYTELYLDYYYKLSYLAEEMKTREEELAVIAGAYDSDGALLSDGMQTLILEEKVRIQSNLDMEAFLGTDLLLEFISFRRDDVYSNENYISDGLNNSELFSKAQEFLVAAEKEIYKSATQQHSITATLKNLLVMREFEPIVDNFSVGNWIRVKIDDVVYRLRLIYYQIDFNDLQNISIEFSDVMRCANGTTDVADILEQASTMATSYSATVHQASQGSKSNSQLQDWVENGLALTKLKIVDSADNQSVTWDSHGILCREYRSVTDDYSDKQLKIIHRGLYLTDDNWLTSKAGIGDFTFYNPSTGLIEEAYGVIADTLVGNLILSEKVGVYNTSNSIVMNENGLTITADATSEGSNNMAMTVQQKLLDENGSEYINQVLYLDGNGNLVLTGSLLVQSASNSDISTLSDLCDDGRIMQQVYSAISSESSNIYSTLNEQVNNVTTELTSQLNSYKAEIGQYMQFSEDGLTLGSSVSDFKTVIDNNGMYFKQGDSTVAYVNNNMLYIPNAVIQNTLSIGNFFFTPHSDGSVSLTWSAD